MNRNSNLPSVNRVDSRADVAESRLHKSAGAESCAVVGLPTALSPRCARWCVLRAGQARLCVSGRKRRVHSAQLLREPGMVGSQEAACGWYGVRAALRKLGVAGSGTTAGRRVTPAGDPDRVYNNFRT